MQQLQGDLYVRKATLEYLGSARYDDVCEVGMRCARVGNSSLSFTAALFRGEDLLVHGEIVYVFADPATQTSRPVPLALRDLLAAFEAGQPMVEVDTGTWADLGTEAMALRHAVYVQEQRIPAALEQDVADATATHAVARNRLGMAVGTGRLLSASPGVAQIGRMAVAQAVRGSGIGGAVLAALVGAARQRGDREVTLSAQSSAVAFYLREGFTVQGAGFEEAGIAHQNMVFALG
jgi:predicted GNAT family N-acyltransferase